MNDLPSPRIALAPGRGPWPLQGTLRGELRGPEAVVAWVGRIGLGAGPEPAWRASRTLERAIRRGGAPDGGARRALATLWARVDAAPGDRLGPSRGEDLAMLLVARDGEGVAVSGVGLQAIVAPDHGRLRAWLAEPHPLLGVPGRPSERPGALALPALPDWLIGVPRGAPLVEDGSIDEILPACGVHG